jgi:hypothetical protein
MLKETKLSLYVLSTLFSMNLLRYPISLLFYLPNRLPSHHFVVLLLNKHKSNGQEVFKIGKDKLAFHDVELAFLSEVD